MNTVISRKSEDEETEEVIDNAKKILQAVQHELALLDDTTGSSIEDLLNRLNINTETYMNALQMSHEGPNIILKCNPKDVFINACNHDILNLWGENVNRQYVINETATVMYVCSYMTKGEKAMGETLKRVAKECRNDDIQTQINKIKKEFLGKRVLGTPESSMRVLSSWLMKKKQKSC